MHKSQKISDRLQLRDARSVERKSIQANFTRADLTEENKELGVLSSSFVMQGVNLEKIDQSFFHYVTANLWCANVTKKHLWCKYFVVYGGTATRHQ